MTPCAKNGNEIGIKKSGIITSNNENHTAVKYHSSYDPCSGDEWRNVGREYVDQLAGVVATYLLFLQSIWVEENRRVERPRIVELVSFVLRKII